jgi:hypothetical protein
MYILYLGWLSDAGSIPPPACAHDKIMVIDQSLVIRSQNLVKVYIERTGRCISSMRMIRASSD